MTDAPALIINESFAISLNILTPIKNINIPINSEKSTIVPMKFITDLIILK